MIDLADLRRTLEVGVSEAGADQLADVAGVLEVARVRLAQRLAVPCPTSAELVTAAEMANRLGVTENWVADAARADRIPSVQLGHYRRFNPAEVLEVVRSLKNTPPQNRPFRGLPKAQERRGGKRAVSKRCPTSPAVQAAETTRGNP